VDESPDQETTLAASEEFDNRRKTLSDVLPCSTSAKRRVFETRRSPRNRSRSWSWPRNSASRAKACGQIEVSAFKKVQNAVKHRVAAMATRRLCRCVSFKPSPVVGETDDGRFAMGGVLQATERRERGALTG